jgi:hypothetical protein
MTTEFQQIKPLAENLLKVAKLWDFFSPQEKERFVSLVFTTMEGFLEAPEGSAFESYKSWENLAKENLSNALEESHGYFGIRDISQKIDAGPFFNEFYKLEFGEI